MANRVQEVNKALRSKGIDAKLYRGNGYYYFWGDAVDHAVSTSVYVSSSDQLTVDEWLAELQPMLAKKD